jgi:DNA-directed RNA polymerase subunit RPC12/RpoP
VSQFASPSERPCPECGGRRELWQDIGPDIDCFSGQAAAEWKRMEKINHRYLTLRCTNCGHLAFLIPQVPSPGL